MTVYELFKRIKLSKLEETKERLSEYRRWQGYFITVLIAVIAYFSTQYKTMDSVLFKLCIVIIPLLAIVIIYCVAKIKKLIKSIGEL